jgi:hypothetical protein
LHHSHVDPGGFLRSLPDGVRPQVRPCLRDFRTGARWVIVQLYYGNRDIHYEAWHRAKVRTIEIGLHFEADEMTNARLLGAFRIHEPAIHRALPGARLEEWAKGWTRIWEPVPAETLDEALQRDVAERMARYITTLEPILRDELPNDVPWALPAGRAQTRTVARGAKKRGAARSAVLRSGASPRRAASSRG